MSEPKRQPVRALWVAAFDRAKADTIGLVRWARCLDRSRVELSCAFLSEPGEAPAAPGSEFAGPISTDLAEAGIDVQFWPRGRRPLGSIARAERFCRERGIELVHSSILRADLFCSRLRRRLGRAGERPALWLSTLAGVGAYRRIRFCRRADWLDRWVYGPADRLVSVSDAVTADWSARLRRPADRFTTIYCGVSDPPAGLPEPGPFKRSIGLEPADRMIVTVARIDREKGIERLVAAAALLEKRGHVPFLGGARKKVRDPFFVVVGDGAWRGRIERQIAAAGLAGRVRLVGNRPDAWSFLRSADLFVLPSHMEGCPQALLEAASARLPVVATAVGGVPELIEHERDGLLVSGPNVERGLADAIGRVLSDPALAERLAASARRRVVERFTAARTADDHAALYERLTRREA